jgi:hypothetical protein
MSGQKCRRRTTHAALHGLLGYADHVGRFMSNPAAESAIDKRRRGSYRHIGSREKYGGTGLQRFRDQPKANRRRPGATKTAVNAAPSRQGRSEVGEGEKQPSTDRARRLESAALGIHADAALQAHTRHDG